MSRLVGYPRRRTCSNVSSTPSSTTEAPQDADNSHEASTLGTRSEFSSASIKAAFAACVGMFVGTTPMIASTQSLFMKPLEGEFHLSRTVVSIILLCAPIAVAITAPIGGRFLDRFGVRKLVIPVLLVFIAVNALMSTASAVWQIILYFVILGSCGSIHSYPAYTKVVATWFSKHRGLVTSLMIACGSSLGSILMPQVVRYLIDNQGWRSAYLCMAAIVAVFGLPVMLAFLRERAQVTNQGNAVAAATVVQSPAYASSDPDFRTAIRSRIAWTIILGITFSVIGLYGTIFHTAALLGERGLPSAVAATTLSAFFAGGMIAQLSVGVLLDKILTPKVSLPFFGLAAIGIYFVHSSSAASLIYLGALFMGFAQGSEHTIASFFIARYFGLRSYNSIYGINWGMASLSVVIGAMTMSVTHDVLGSYGVMGIVLPLSMVTTVILYATLPSYPAPAGRPAG